MRNAIISSLYTFCLYFLYFHIHFCVRDNGPYKDGGEVSDVSDDVATKPVFVAGAAVAETGQLGAVQLDELAVRRPAAKLLPKSVQRCR